ncbi:Uncharacterized protein DAT39_016610, partial [Clarias magur]
MAAPVDEPHANGSAPPDRNFEELMRSGQYLTAPGPGRGTLMMVWRCYTCQDKSDRHVGSPFPWMFSCSQKEEEQKQEPRWPDVCLLLDLLNEVPFLSLNALVCCPSWRSLQFAAQFLVQAPDNVNQH